MSADKGIPDPGGQRAEGLRQIVHELNNRLFVLRMSVASLTETLGTETPDAMRPRLEAIASAADEAETLVRRLAASIHGAADARNIP